MRKEKEYISVCVDCGRKVEQGEAQCSYCRLQLNG
jgi:hypothetical protein